MTAADFYQKIYPATGAVDGIIPENRLNKHCAHLSNDNGTSAEWWTDLGDVYKIYNITLYARTDGKLHFIIGHIWFSVKWLNINIINCCT